MIDRSRIPLRRRVGVFEIFAILAFVISFGWMPSAQGHAQYEPIDIEVGYQIVAGEPLACDVQLTGGPSYINIYSDPPGAVSYSGTVTSAAATVAAATSSQASGTVTVYLETDGEVVVSTEVSAEP